MTFRRFLLAALCIATFAASSLAQQTKSLRVFLRGGPKTHGPAGNGLHEHEKWLTEWKKLLADRGATVDGALKFPTAEQLDKTDVLVMFAAEAGSIAGADRDNLEKFLKRGGGIVAIHDAVCGTNAHWFKTIIGGAWEHKHSKWFEGDMSLYYVDNSHPISAGCSNFDMDDEVYWDLHLVPEARILAASWAPDRRNTRNGRQFPHIYDIIPQMWTYEKDNYRAFVSIPGHKWKSFELPHYRAVLLRGIAWAGKRERGLTLPQGRTRHAALSGGRAHRARESRREARTASRLQHLARRRRAAHQQSRSSSTGIPPAASGSPKRPSTRTAAAASSPTRRRRMEGSRRPDP